MAYANTFKRMEMKLLLDEEQYSKLREKIDSYMTADEYGVHTIMNIYFDNDNNDVIINSLSKPVYKEKLRLRAYGNAAEDNDQAFLEIKKKYRGVVHKRRLEMTYKELFDYAAGGIMPDISENQRQVFSEIEYFRKRLGLKPKIVICYDRQAFFGNDDKEFRMTFDSNIRSRRTDVDLRKGDFGELLNKQPYKILEIKTTGAVPLWLVKFLSENKIYASTFSKYGNIFLNEVKTNKACKKSLNKIQNRREKECFQA